MIVDTSLSFGKRYINKPVVGSYTVISQDLEFYKTHAECTKMAKPLNKSDILKAFCVKIEGGSRE